MPIPTLLTKKAAAEALGVSIRTIDRLRAAGEVQAVLAGSQVRLIEESVAAYIARQIPPSSKAEAEAKFTPQLIARRRAERAAREAA